jgi:hypothetical protein
LEFKAKEVLQGIESLGEESVSCKMYSSCFLLAKPIPFQLVRSYIQQNLEKKSMQQGIESVSLVIDMRLKEKAGTQSTLVRIKD